MKTNTLTIVKASDLPEDVKLEIECALMLMNEPKYKAEQYLEKKVLEAMPIGEPIRVKDIQAKAFPFLSIQKLTPHLYQSSIKRKVVNTGKKFTVMKEEYLGNLKWGKRPVEVEEEIAFFTRIK